MNTGRIKMQDFTAHYKLVERTHFSTGSPHGDSYALNSVWLKKSKDAVTDRQRVVKVIEDTVHFLVALSHEHIYILDFNMHLRLGSWNQICDSAL